MRHVLAALAIVLSFPAWAEEPVEKRSTFSLLVENDSFARTDRHYTNGIRASWLSAENDVPEFVQDLSGWIPTFAPGGARRAGFALGQNMYTPQDIERRIPDPTDRPYAGWLYGGVGVVSDNGDRLDSFELDLGVVGPSAQAEWAQSSVHDIINVGQPKGWDSQLRDEPGIVLFLERKWRLWRKPLIDGLELEAMPHVGTALGNVFTYAAAGASLRLGHDLPADYGPPRIRPSLPGSAFFSTGETFGWYLFAGIEGRAVARNIFLDGSTFRSGPSVDKEWAVGDVQAGISFLFPRFRVTYTQVLRSREFEGQDGPDLFGALSLSFNF